MQSDEDKVHQGGNHLENILQGQHKSRGQRGHPCDVILKLKDERGLAEWREPGKNMCGGQGDTVYENREGEILFKKF
jgi:hypothetical protein